MKNILKILLIITALITTIQASSDSNNTILKVGTKVAPPFSMKGSDGKWIGISIELWELIAKKLNYKYKFQEETLESLLNNVKNRDLDVGIAALTVTPEREKVLDFSHSYYTTWLGIAVQKKETNTAMIILQSIFSIKMLYILLALTGTLLCVGALIWLTERRKHPETFDANLIKGIGNASWWAATTMTTVGYGDITPKSTGGRVIAFIWMLASLFIVASIIATLSSALTVSKIDGPIVTQKDLARGKVASIKGSVSDQFLRSRRLYLLYYKDIESGLEAVKNGSVDAMVYDAPLLQYYINEKFRKSLTLTGVQFETQNYSIMVPQGSKRLEEINQALLEIIASPAWEDILHRYLDYSNRSK